ncbi:MULTISPECIES: HIT family protein [unclassified Halomonas]|uniref:HIT family protein n=1 Tax=unclassified Halomonas TaxID=2609666 RepID=UPI0006D9BD25|nr:MULTISPECIES: HIT domain-containing protein [unclassified Halomonas]KPQ20476.1 MAG: putative hydrolase [Halomonas sp. HL-93]SBR46272.1 Diadenosine tetraphosphate (Ap4A) hydrolase [Halomonas sp. HL-93]SNY98669.1 Diadenosine tetraphosphate (Ap4A) hydrolase [Halomonas sp. hl-4]
MTTFVLDERLANDTQLLADLPLCRALLMLDARYPWVILVPRREALSEIFELTADEQQQLWKEASQLGEAMKTAFNGDKLNIATLGNVVSQLHVHVVVRRQDDDVWPAPVWGNGAAEPYSPSHQRAVQAHLLELLEALS